MKPISDEKIKKQLKFKNSISDKEYKFVDKKSVRNYKYAFSVTFSKAVIGADYEKLAKGIKAPWLEKTGK